MVIESVASGFISAMAGYVAPLAKLWVESQIRKSEIELKKEEINFRKEQAKIEVLQARHLHQVAMNERDIERDIQATGQKSQSYGHDRASYSVGNGSILLIVVDAIRGLVRPAVTLWQVWVLWQITRSLELFTMVSTFNESAQLDLANQLIDATVILTFMTVGWWFGHRTAIKKIT